MQTRLKYAIVATVAILAVLAGTVLFTDPVQAGHYVRYRIWQSPGVSANGNVTFTKDGVPVGGPFPVSCDGEEKIYVFYCTTKPNDISWDITIDWSEACGNPAHNAESWTGANQPWPKKYVKTHTHAGEDEEWEVGFELQVVGGVSIPIDKLALLAPYVALAVAIVAIALGAMSARKRWLGKTVVPKL